MSPDMKPSMIELCETNMMVARRNRFYGSGLIRNGFNRNKSVRWSSEDLGKNETGHLLQDNITVKNWDAKIFI